MAAIQLAVARYISDPVRNEPRNVGVIAWSEGKTAARFLGEGRRTGTPARPKRAGIEDWGTYLQWIRFWRSHLEAGSIRDPYRMETVQASDSTFLEALASVTRGNFDLRLGGEAYQGSGAALELVVQEAFNRIVAAPRGETPTPRSADAVMSPPPSRKRLISKAYRVLSRRYKEDRDFVREYRMVGQTLKGSDVPAVFDFGVFTASQPLGEVVAPVLLLDAVSFKANSSSGGDVLDRARAVAAKAIEVKGNEPNTVVRALVSNGGSETSQLARYVAQLLKDEAGVSMISVDQLRGMLPAIRGDANS